MPQARLGIIGGSGLTRLRGFEQSAEEEIRTPFGAPSAPLVTGELAGVPIAFLPRHGRGHQFPPTAVPYRANVHAMLQAGVERILSVSAVGSLREELAPQDFVLVGQFIDRSIRVRSFFDRGCVVHVPFAEPTDAQMREVLEEAARQSPELRVHQGGTYLTMEGPQFSSRAESELYRQWGADVIGMTNGTEARLAREAGLGFASVAMVTDYDCWHPGHEDVQVDQVLAVMKANLRRVGDLLRAALPALAELGACEWAGVARRSLVTDPEFMTAEDRARFSHLLGW